MKLPSHIWHGRSRIQQGRIRQGSRLHCLLFSANDRPGRLNRYRRRPSNTGHVSNTTIGTIGSIVLGVDGPAINGSAVTAVVAVLGAVVAVPDAILTPF